MPDAFVAEEVDVDWINHHENVTARIAKRLTVSNEVPAQPTMAGMRATAARLQGLIAQALQAGARLRACGSRWSFSDIPVVADGWIIETSRLDWRFNIAVVDLDPGFAGTADELFLVQGGAKISKINEALETSQKRRALRTSGASNGQTIAGALGTGVHGSAIDVGALESQVAGIQLLTATQNLWIERASMPALNPAFPAKLGATLVRNDLLFEAAIVSLGALGIVHAVLLRTTGRYLLNSSLSHIPMGQIATALNTLQFAGAGLPDPTRRPYFFQVILDPRRLDIAYATVRYKENWRPGYEADYNLVTGSEPGTNVPRMIGAAINMFPDLRDTAVSLLMKDQLRVRSDTPDDWSSPGETYPFTNARRGVASSAFAVPVAQVSRALEIMRAAFLVHKSAPVVFTCRYAQKSPGILSFVRYDPCCIIDIDGIDSPATQKLIKLVADRFDAAEMPYTQHWGKINNLTRARVRNGYGGGVDRWNQARRMLLTSQAERNLFSSPLLDGFALNA
jgi:FAD/FMN-containing dehydrogenase